MNNPNLLNCLILTRNTLSFSSTLTLFVYFPPFLPLSPLPFFFLIYISLTPSLSLFIFPSLSSSLHLSSFLSPSLSNILPPSAPPSLCLSPPAHILPSLYFASLLFAIPFLSILHFMTFL